MRQLGFWVVGGALGIALSCESSDGGGAGAGEFCPSLEGYVGDCDQPNECERAIVRDCDPLRAVVTAEFATAAAECMNALGRPQDCLADATRRTTSSSAVEDFATALCLECGDGAGDCESEVLAADDDSAFGRAGRLARVLTRDSLDRVQDDCTTGDDCAANFESCAKQVLSRDVPDQSAGCLVDAVFDSYDASCGASTDPTEDTDSQSGTDTDTTASDTFPTDPSNPTDPSDPTGGETEGDTEGDCDDVDCPCMFNEDCAGSLICPEGTCVAGEACGDDEFEPNNGEIQATLLAPITDDDDDGTQLQGELEAATDIDWFRYEGEDTAFAQVGPYAQVNINALEVCIYAECLKGLGQTEVTCPKGATQQPSPGGRPGCCAANTDGFEVDLSCNGGVLSDEGAQIYMSVTGSEPGVCQEYTLTYHF